MASTPGKITTSNNTFSGVNIKETFWNMKITHASNNKVMSVKNKFFPPKKRMNLVENKLDRSFGLSFSIYPPQSKCFTFILQDNVDLCEPSLQLHTQKFT